jgi:predicted pPIWI-associating nuclease
MSEPPDSPVKKSSQESLAESLRLNRQDAQRLSASLLAAHTFSAKSLMSFARIQDQFALDIAKLAPTFHSLSHLISSNTILDVLRSSHVALANAMPSHSLLQDIAKHSLTPAHEWSTAAQVLRDAIGPLQATTLSFQIHFARVSEISLMAQAHFEALQLSGIGDALRIASAEQANLRLLISEITGSYSDLLSSFSTKHSGIAAFAPIVSGLPPVEFYNALSLGRAVSERETVPSTEDGLLGAEIRGDSEISLEQLLRELQPELQRLWVGAKQALKSSNPDRVRHCATSLRELYDHVVRAIAPDDAIMNWSKDPNHFQDARPTRRARLHYICRQIDHGPFKTFVEKDVAATLAFHSLFQQGTHAVSSDFTEAQLVAMVQRMDGTLRFLLELWRQGNS